MAELLGYSESNMGYSLKEYKRMIVVYYHDDLDGQCSAAQVRESMEDITANPIRCIAVQYNGTIWKKEEIEERICLSPIQTATYDVRFKNRWLMTAQED